MHQVDNAPGEPRPSQGGADQGSTAAIGGSAALISICTIISRITGFARTWAMAFALGSTLLSSSYQVANTLPNQLYELVCGGMIVTAFLPVYVSVKKKLGQRAGNEYASNLLTLVVLLLGAVSLLCMLFPSAAIYTQSFYSDQSQMATSVFFFQFFAIQIVVLWMLGYCVGPAQRKPRLPVVVHSSGGEQPDRHRHVLGVLVRGPV